MKRFLLPVLLFLNSLCAICQEKSITLNEAINTGISNNHSLKASYQEIQIAKGNYKANFFLPSPVLNLDYQQVPSGEAFKDAEQITYSIEQDFEFPLRYPAKIKSLKAGVNSAELNYKLAELSLKAEIRNAYLNWLGSIAEVNIAQENIRLSEEFLSSSAKLYEAGEIGSIPLSQAKFSLSQAKLQLNSALNNQLQKRASLLTLLGLENETILQPADSIFQYSTLATLPLMFDTTTQANLQYSNSLVAQTQADLNYQRTAYLPDLRLELMKQTILGNSAYYGAAIGITIPLWFFNQKGAIQRTKASYIQNKENYEQAKLAINNQWKTSQAAFVQYQSTIEEYNNMAKESEILIQNAKKAYNVGELSYLEYIAAQQSYIAAKSAFLEAILNFQISLTDYYQIIGGF